jgi:amino acid transporter
MLKRLWRMVIGAPKDVRDPDALHKVSLIALLAWVGLGADGLSSSAYGPDEAFRALGKHTGLAFFLALATALTVLIISYGYSRILEQFPTGGGGYVVATKLLGRNAGLISGAALLIDYVLTITISIASGADALFSFLPADWLSMKLYVAFAALVLLTVMNLRGVKESVTALAPIFGLFLLTHFVLLVIAIGGHVGDASATVSEVRHNISGTASELGTVGMLLLFVRAYSIGGGTYTGIEAVSNGLAMMREPRVVTGKRTMVLMATSLALTAGGILLAYLLVHASPEPGKTMNAVLLERVASSWNIAGVPVGRGFIVTTLLSEGALLFVAAQAGFLDGPRVMANMATDSWLPHRLAALSERLAMRNGVLWMAVAALAALLYTGGDVSKLVVMYSINVFVTFSLSNFAMMRFWLAERRAGRWWKKNFSAHMLAWLLCVTILVVTVFEKFTEGGWVTLLVTSALIAACFFIKRRYRDVVAAIRRLDVELPSPGIVDELARKDLRKDVAEFVETESHLSEHHPVNEPESADPVLVLFVGGYSGLGRHALLNLLKMFPDHFKGAVFASVAVVDSESFKGKDELLHLEQRTREQLVFYERFAQHHGMRAASMFSVGVEVPEQAEHIAKELTARYPRALFVAGQLIFEEDTFWNRVLHNETAFSVQRRLQRCGIPMIVLPVELAV